MRLPLVIVLALLGSGCTSDGVSEAQPAQPAVTTTAGSPAPKPSVTATPGYVLSQVRRGCGPSDFVGVVGHLTGPSGILDFDGLTVELRAGNTVVGTTALAGSDFIVYPKGGRELPTAADVRVVAEDGRVLAQQAAVDLRFEATTPPAICG